MKTEDQQIINEVSDLLKEYERSEPIKARGIGLYSKTKNSKGLPIDRYYLYIANNLEAKKILTVIMLNPSITFPSKGFDKTVENIIRIAECAVVEKEQIKFSAIEVLNLFSYINGNREGAKKYIQTHKQENDINEKFIIKFIDKFILPKDSNRIVMVAWGSEYKNDVEDRYLDQIRTKLKDAYTFCPRKLNYPKHPGGQGLNLDCCLNYCNNKNKKEGTIKLEKYDFCFSNK